MQDVGANGVNDARAVGERHAAVERALTRAIKDHEVAVIETCRFDPDADLTLVGFGLADIGSHDATGTGTVAQMVGFHRCSSVYSHGRARSVRSDSTVRVKRFLR